MGFSGLHGEGAEQCEYGEEACPCLFHGYSLASADDCLLQGFTMTSLGHQFLVKSFYASCHVAGGSFETCEVFVTAQRVAIYMGST